MRLNFVKLLKFSSIILIFSIVVFFLVFDLRLNMRIYWRDWVIKEEFKTGLHGCFGNLTSPSTTENDTNLYTYYNDIVPSIPLTDGYDCFDFAESIKLKHGQPLEHVIFHTYWRVDLQPLSDKQIATLKSFFATQNPNYTSLILWSNGNLTGDPILKPFFERFPDRFKTITCNLKDLSVGTPMENHKYLGLKDDFAYLDGDLIRLLVLYKHGGMWFDMDSLLIRDFSPLMEYEWLIQWDCFLPDNFPFNGAFMRFRQNSPYLCEFLAEMSNGPLPKKDSYDWGAIIYYKTYRRLIQNKVQPFKVIPWCFTDPQFCHPYNSMPNAFIEVELNKRRLLQIFAYHWHNQWHKKKGTLFKFLEQRNNDLLGF